MNNGFPFGSLLTYTAGDVICVAVDFTAKKMWFRKNNTNWNNNSSNPAAGSGGFGISSIPRPGAADRWYPAGGIYGSGDNILSCFRSSEMTYSAPSGFSTFG